MLKRIRELVSLNTNHSILFLLIIVTGLFLFLRIHSVLQETVPYTFDQGRDFMAARNIIVNRDIVLIGPTTGAQGIFHGVWWYYLLAVPFVLTGGTVIAYYYFFAFFTLAQAGLLYFFIKREMGPLLGLFAFVVLAMSPYFINMSVFPISSISVFPALLVFMYGLYEYFRTGKNIYGFFIGLGAGLVFEGEIPFGLFMLPSIVLALLLSRNLRGFIIKPKRLAFTAVGLLLAVSLRIVSELKHSFLQTKAFFALPGRASELNQTFSDVLNSRAELFLGYFNGLVQDDMRPLLWVVAIASVIGYLLGYKKLKEHERKFALVMWLIVLFLFVLTLFYTKNPFYVNYYEGIQYLFLVLIIVGLYALGKYDKTFVVVLVSASVGFIVAHGILLAIQKSGVAGAPPNIGLRMHTTAVEYVYEQTRGENFCLRIYTPPVIPHTYAYLLDYMSRTKGFPYPRTEYINNECWYFIESDSFKERRDAWIDAQIPSDAEKTQEFNVSDNLVIQKWELPEETSQ